MKKYSKKVALILALALTLAMAIPALATQTNIQGAYTATGDQVINVAISGGSTVRAMLNPGGFTADIYDIEGDVESGVIGRLEPSGEITTMPIVGINMGGSPVKIRATVTGALNGNFKFASSVPTQKSTTGLVFLEAMALPTGKDAYNLEADVSDDYGYPQITYNRQKTLQVLNDWEHSWIDQDLYKTGTEGRAEKKVFTDGFNALKKTNQWTNNTRGDADYHKYYKNEIVVLKKGVAESKQQLCTVAAAKGEGEYGYFVARLSGRVGAGDPDKAGKYWTENDGFGASIIWTFQSTKDNGYFNSQF